MPLVNWQAQADTGDIRLVNGVVELGYASASYSAVAYLGSVFHLEDQFAAPSVPSRGPGEHNVQLAASTFWGIRTNPINCGAALSGPMLPLPASGGCRTETLIGSSWVELLPNNYLAMETLTRSVKPISPSRGDVYLVRFGSSATQDDLYIKLLFTEVMVHHAHANGTSTSISTVMIRWSNLYNRRAYSGGQSFCDISAASPSLLTNVAFSNLNSPTYFGYDDGWIGAIFVIFLIALIIILFLILAVSFWLRSLSKEQSQLIRAMQQRNGQPPVGPDGEPRPPAPAGDGDVELQQPANDFL